MRREKGGEVGRGERVITMGDEVGKMEEIGPTVAGEDVTHRRPTDLRQVLI